MINMKNSYLLCEDNTETLNEQSSGFVTGNLSNFKLVTVIQSNEEDIPVGSKVKISINAGQKDDAGLIIKRGEVIWVE